MSASLTMDTKDHQELGGAMAWLVCITGGLFFFYEFFQLNLFDVINQPLRESFHIDPAQLGLMSSAYLWANIIFLLPAGILLDRFSVRKVILSTMAICIIGTVGFAFTKSFLLASFFHFLSGIGNAFCFLSSVVLVSRWFPPRQQAFVIGCVVTLAFLGGMLAHTPLVILNKYVGWRGSLQLDGAFGLVIFAILFFMVKDKPISDEPSTKREHQPILPSFIKAITNRQTILPGIYTSFLNLPIMVLCALWGASYLQTAHHIPDLEASTIISFIFIGSIVGCPLAGWISDKQGRRKPIMFIGAIATLIAMYPLFQGVILSEGYLKLIFFSIGLFTSTQVISYPLIAESNNPNTTGAATGVASLIIMGGAAIAQVIFGLLLGKNPVTADFQLAMWLFPISTLIALMVVAFTKETNCKNINQGVFNGSD